jgi:hypothetical protein
LRCVQWNNASFYQASRLPFFHVLVCPALAPFCFSEISATRTQSGGTPATVKIFNAQSNPEMRGFGTLTFAVPGMNAALAGMEEKQDFIVSIEGQEVFNMSWRDGAAARAALRCCIGQN